MGVLDAQTLARFATLRRQLRDIAGMVESRPGLFSCSGLPLIELVSNAEKAFAELRGAGSSVPVIRFDLDDPLAVRKLVDEARRRVARQGDD